MFGPPRMAAFPSQANEPTWLDLSYFVFNPHFVDLFSDNLQLRLGRCEITVNDKLGNHLSAQASSMDPFVGNILQSMFLTQPPCKSLGIYMPGVSYLGMNLVTRVCNADGIRVGHLLAELQRNLPKAINLWRIRSQAMQKDILQSPWTTFTTFRQKHQRWITPGFPKLVVFLDSTDHKGPTFVQSTYLQSEYHNRMWEVEWY
jgi:hypothetical protein